MYTASSPYSFNDDGHKIVLKSRETLVQNINRQEETSHVYAVISVYLIQTEFK
jgi:hypothetical protein